MAAGREKEGGGRGRVLGGKEGKKVRVRFGGVKTGVQVAPSASSCGDCGQEDGGRMFWKKRRLSTVAWTPLGTQGFLE